MVKNECIKIMGWSLIKNGDTLLTDISINLPNTKPEGESEYITTDKAFSVGDSNKSPESEDYFINPINADDIQTTISGEPVFIQLSTTDKGFVDLNVSGKKLYKISYKYSNNASENVRTNTLIIGNTLRCIFTLAGRQTVIPNIWLADVNDINQKYIAIKIGNTTTKLYNYRDDIKYIYDNNAIGNDTSITVYLLPKYSDDNNNNKLYICTVNANNITPIAYNIDNTSVNIPYNITDNKLYFNVPMNSSANTIDNYFTWTLSNYPTVNLHIVNDLIYVIYSIKIYSICYSNLDSDGDAAWLTWITANLNINNNNDTKQINLNYSENTKFYSRSNYYEWPITFTTVNENDEVGSIWFTMGGELPSSEQPTITVEFELSLKINGNNTNLGTSDMEITTSDDIKFSITTTPVTGSSGITESTLLGRIVSNRLVLLFNTDEDDNILKNKIELKTYTNTYGYIINMSNKFLNTAYLIPQDPNNS